jgi:hypothetical protein
MRAKRLLLMVVVAGGCIILALLWWSTLPPKSGRQEIGKVLLGYHLQFTTNGYSEAGLRVPDLFLNLYGPGGFMSAETNFVAYRRNSRRLGMNYAQILDLSRVPPGNTNWRLAGISGLQLPLWGWVTWRDRGIIITNGS